MCLTLEYLLVYCFVFEFVIALCLLKSVCLRIFDLYLLEVVGVCFLFVLVGCFVIVLLSSACVAGVVG